MYVHLRIRRITVHSLEYTHTQGRIEALWTLLFHKGKIPVIQLFSFMILFSPLSSNFHKALQDEKGSLIRPWHMTDCVFMRGCVWCVWVFVCKWKIIRLSGGLEGLRWGVYTGGCLCTLVNVCVHLCTSTYRRGVGLVRPISTKS